MSFPKVTPLTNVIPEHQEYNEMNELLTQGIYFLVGFCEMSLADIDRELGCIGTDGKPTGMTSKVLNEGKVFSLPKARRFSQLLTRRGFDEFANSFIAAETGKTVGVSTPGVANGTYLDDLKGLMQAIGSCVTETDANNIPFALHLISIAEQSLANWKEELRQDQLRYANSTTSIQGSARFGTANNATPRQGNIGPVRRRFTEADHTGSINPLSRYQPGSGPDPGGSLPAVPTRNRTLGD